MKKIRLVAMTVATTALCCFASIAQALPVQFDITSATLAGGLGYGVDSGQNPENGGTLLDVLFGTTFTQQTFTLNNIGDSYSFNIGRINFREPNTGSGNNQGIRAAEQDELGVSATFTFGNPLGTTLTVSTAGIATTGLINDQEVDYKLIWSPINVSFGAGGLFEISLGNISFSDIGTADETVTVKLLNAPGQALTNLSVPEPTSLALLGLGLAGVGFGRRNKS